MTGARTPCINPRCRRTFKDEHEGETVVCRKCWLLLPASLRARDKQLRRRMRLIERMSAKGVQHRRRGRKFGHPDKGAPQAFTMGNKFGRLWDIHWARIRAFYIAPEKPEGLDAFLEEVGL